jgi:SSS family solute:Na+ symporter
LATIDIFIIFGFIIYAISSGFKNKDDASKNLEEYFLAGRSLKGWKAGVSMAATQFAADTPLLVTGLIATAGIFSLWRLWIYALSFLLMGFILAASWRRANVLTDAELTEVRYGEKAALWLRGVKAVYFGTIINCTVMAMVLLAATRIAEPFLLWNDWLPSGLYEFVQSVVQGVGVPFTVNTASSDIWILSTNNILSILTIVLVTTLYSTSGGLRSVVATDVVQFFLMMIATLFYTFYVIDAVGGLEAMIEKLKVLYNSANTELSFNELVSFTPGQAKDIGGSLFVVLAFQWLIQMNSDGTGYLAQRSMACKSEKDAKIAAIVFSFCQIFLRSLFWLPIGLGLILLFPIEASENMVSLREATFVTGMNELLPPGVKGLLLTGMLAALASTIDTHLNWGSSYWSNDIYKRLWCEVYKKKEANNKTLVRVARLSNIMILIIALIIMANLDNIQTAWKASLILGASMGIPLLLRWFWWRMNSWGEISAILMSLVMTPVLLFGYPELSEATRLLIMALMSSLACFFGIYFFGPEKQETLQAFYEKVRPLGFWGQVIQNDEELKQNRLKLKNNLIALIACAISLFTLLVGVGSLIVSSPGPSWIGHPMIWVSLNIIIGLVCIPIWYRYGFKKV